MVRMGGVLGVDMTPLGGAGWRWVVLGGAGWVGGGRAGGRVSRVTALGSRSKWMQLRIYFQIELFIQSIRPWTKTIFRQFCGNRHQLPPSPSPSFPLLPPPSPSFPIHWVENRTGS